MRKLSLAQIKALAEAAGYEFASLMALIMVESGGIGFAPDGKLIIQFEPAWFKRLKPYTPSGLWSVNKVDRQVREWAAFNDAFEKDPTAAMESTSIGMMQVMGFNYKSLGFATVNDMWDFAKQSEANQVELAIRFIKAKPLLDHGLKIKDWPTVAYHYNGQAYRKFKYDTRLQSAYQSASSMSAKIA